MTNKLTEVEVGALTKAKWSAADVRQLYNPTTKKNVVVEAWVYAVWVAFYESGWDADTEVHDHDDDSYGLFGINMKGALGPERRRKSGLRADADLLDPTTNVRVAHEIFSERGWSAWAQTTRDRADAKVLSIDYGRGAGEGADPTAAGPVAGNTREAGLYPGQLDLEAGVRSATVGALDGIRAVLAVISNPGFWRRLGIGLLGGLFVFVALFLVVGGKAPTPARLAMKLAK